MLALIAVALAVPVALLAVTLVPAVGVSLILSRYWNPAHAEVAGRDQAPPSLTPVSLRLQTVAG
jgi:hypothetical protein